jgi:hypothetical protein
VTPRHRRRHTQGGSGGDDEIGMAAAGLGNDAGGSVRIPVSFCGVAALTTTYGRLAADHRIGPDDPGGARGLSSSTARRRAAWRI